MPHPQSLVRMSVTVGLCLHFVRLIAQIVLDGVYMVNVHVLLHQ